MSEEGIAVCPVSLPAWLLLLSSLPAKLWPHWPVWLSPSPHLENLLPASFSAT